MKRNHLSNRAHFYMQQTGVDKRFKREQLRNKWAEELSSVTKDDIGPIKSSQSLSDGEVQKINRMLQEGHSLSEIYEETGHAEGTVIKYRRKLIAAGIKLGKKVEPYERKDIPYERDTDVQLLANRFGVTSLDSSPYDAGHTERHEWYASGALSPDEVLMLKEDEEDELDDFFPCLMSWLHSLPSREREAAEKIMFSDGTADIEVLMLRFEAFKIYKHEPKQTLISSAAWPVSEKSDTWKNYHPNGERPAGVEPDRWRKWVEKGKNLEEIRPLTENGRRKFLRWKIEKELRKTG